MDSGNLIDTYISFFQTVLFAALGLFLLLRARRTANEPAVALMGGGLLCNALGNLFFALYYLLRHAYTSNFSAADVAWIGSFFFYIAAHNLLKLPREKAPAASWLLTAGVAGGMAAVIALYGNPAVNLLWGVPLAMLAWRCGTGLRATRAGAGRERLRPFYLSLAVHLACEIVCFLSWGIFYACVDGVLTLALTAMGLFFYRGVGKA